MAEETKNVVQKEEAEASRKAKETQAIADDAQRDLSEALPALVRLRSTYSDKASSSVIAYHHIYSDKPSFLHVLKSLHIDCNKRDFHHASTYRQQQTHLSKFIGVSAVINPPSISYLQQ